VDVESGFLFRTLQGVAGAGHFLAPAGNTVTGKVTFKTESTQNGHSLNFRADLNSLFHHYFAGESYEFTARDFEGRSAGKAPLKEDWPQEIRSHPQENLSGHAGEIKFPGQNPHCRHEEDHVRRQGTL